MANLNKILANGPSMDTSERAIMLNEALGGDSADIVGYALDSLNQSEYHISAKQIVNSSLLKAKTYAIGTAQYRADRSRWTKKVADVASLRYSILKGQHEGNPIAENYLAWTSLDPKLKAKAVLSELYFALFSMDNTFNDRGAFLVAAAAAYSYLGEGNTDPLAAENWFVSPSGKKFVPYKDKRTGKPKPGGTGIGLQQWSFYRHDDLLLNLEKWQRNIDKNSLGTILPLASIQLLFAAKELIKDAPHLIKVANKPNSNINEVLFHFLQVQNGPGYKGVCVKRLLNERLKLNKLGVFTGDFEASAEGVMAYARVWNTNGKGCPNV